MSFNITNLDTNLKDVADWLSKEYGQVHTGRATPIILDSVMVEAFGSWQPIKNMGSINIEDARTLRVSIWDKALSKEVEKAIGAANLGLSVAPDSDGMRVIFPVLTTENRSRLVKALKDKLEEARISVRKERENSLNELKSADLPEDDARRAKEDIQKRVDAANVKLEAIFESKEKEVMN